MTALVSLFGTISIPPHVTPFAGPLCVQKEPGCSPRLALTSTGLREGSVKVSELPEFHLSCETTLWYNLKLYSAAWLKLHRVGQSDSYGWGYCFLSGWCHLERSALPEKDGWFLQHGEWLSTGILVAVPSVPSPEPPAPVSPHKSLVHSVLPLL